MKKYPKTELAVAAGAFIAVFLCILVVFAEPSEKRIKASVLWDPEDFPQWYCIQFVRELSCRFGESVSFDIFYSSSSVESLRQVLLLEKGLAALLAYTQGRILIPSPDWEEAARYAGVGPEDIAASIKNGRAKELYDGRKPPLQLQEEYRKKKYPLIMAENEIYSGKPGLAGWASFINRLLPAEKRVNFLTGEVSAENKATLTVVQDSASVSGMMDRQVADYFKRLSADALVVVMDISDSGAGDILKKYGSGKLPLYLLDKDAEDKAFFVKLSRTGMVHDKNGAYIFNPRGAGAFFYGRQEIPGDLKVFVMPECPAGMAAERAVFEPGSKDDFPEEVNVTLHYIVRKTTSPAAPFVSVHGRSEWEEAARQKIIAKYFPEKIRGYLEQRNRAPDSSLWDRIADSSGIDPGFINEKFEEGKKLLTEDADLAAELGVSASPTFLWENRHLVVGLRSLKEIKEFSKIKIENTDTCGDQ